MQECRWQLKVYINYVKSLKLNVRKQPVVAKDDVKVTVLLANKS